MDRIIDIKKLFHEKKYSEIIFYLENKLTENQKDSANLNLLGACRLLKGKANKEDLFLALSDFRLAYLIEEKTNNSKEAFLNFINVSIDLFEYENSKKNHRLSSENFMEVIKYFEKNEIFFLKDTRIILGIIRVYKRLADTNKVNMCLETLLKNENFNPFIINNYIYNNCFSKNWAQKDFLKYGKILDQYLPSYSKDKIIPLNLKKKQKIRIGFLSADLKKKHPITYFLKTILTSYNQNEFEIFLYLNQKEKDEDKTTIDFKQLAFKSREIFDLSDIEAINEIRGDSIDIVIDLMGVTSKNRLSLIKNRIAPAQILWCGYCNTTGIKEMDYIIADPNLINKSESNEYSEKIICLPKIWNCHSGINIERKYTEPPLVRNKGITFGSFNNFRKINDSVVKVWSTILKQIPNSKLILKSSSVLSNDLLSKKFREYEVLQFIEFEPFVKDFKSHMNLYKKIDIALDTFPYNGVTTSFESIWMGVPVLTMKGYNFNSRCGESINKNLGMHDLIAKNEMEYILKANQIASDYKKLTKIRKKIFDNALTSPLFDVEDFSNNFFQSLKKILN